MQKPLSLLLATTQLGSIAPIGFPATAAPSTSSHWSAFNRGSSNHLLGYGSNGPLPLQADVVIVGAGITGSAIAHFLAHIDTPPARIVLLEAREIASGATGRNGGFVKPVPFRAYTAYKAAYGMDTALQLVESEYDNLDLTAKLVEEGEIDTEFRMRDHREIVLDNATALLHKSQLDFIRTDRATRGIAQTDGVTWYSNVTEAQSVTRSKVAVAAYTFRTGTLWPHKFVHALLKNLLDIPSSPFSLFTRTPVTRIHQIVASSTSSSLERNDSSWVVTTPRGNITTGKLILATNGYTPALLAELYLSSSKSANHVSLEELLQISPKRSQMASYTPPISFDKPIEFTFGVRGGSYPEASSSTSSASSGGEEAYGMTVEDGTWIVGSEWAGIAAQQGLEQQDPSQAKLWEESTDDTVVSAAAQEFYRHLPSRIFEGWESKHEGLGEGIIRSWTGIQGHTPDGFPYVGNVPGTPGLYVAAGFHGHGMARCLIAARGLVHQLQSKTGDEWDKRLPEVFRISKERGQRAKLLKNSEAVWRGGQ